MICDTYSIYEKGIIFCFIYRSDYSRGILVSLALKWTRGDSLKEILKGNKYNGESGMNKIEETIDLLQTTVSYKMPLLLKPFYDMKESESTFLTSMQSGATDIVTRTMIEMGIPRETSIYLFENWFNLHQKVELDKEELEDRIRQNIKERYTDFPYWIQVQLNFLI